MLALLCFYDATVFSVNKDLYIKKKGHTLDIAPLSEGTSLQSCSGIARVVEGFHSFTCTPTRLSTQEMNHTCLCLSSQSWSSFTDREGMKG